MSFREQKIMILLFGFMLHLWKASILILVPRNFGMPLLSNIISHCLICLQSVMVVVLPLVLITFWFVEEVACCPASQWNQGCYGDLGVSATWNCGCWGWGSAWWDPYCWFVCSQGLAATGWGIVWYTYCWYWHPIIFSPYSWQNSVECRSWKED